MKTYGIIGFPLTHSFSKQYFSEKIEKEGIADAIFYSFPLETIAAFPDLLKSNPFLCGLSVTIPYKEQVMQYLTRLSPEAAAIGAVNCIRIRDGVLTGYNTDIIGFEKSFEKKLSPHHKKALILGTGGASKAVQYVLKKLGIDFFIVSRTATGTASCIQYNQITEAIIGECSIIINSTPLGMSPDEDTCPDIPYELLTARHYLYDLVYNPVKTLFLQNGERQGAAVENGYDMLIIQAEENWQRWNAD